VSLELDAAYARCEAITREQAANFFYGIRLLPRERRRAISAVYAFARRIDDIGDGQLPRERKLELLDAERRSLSALAGGEASVDGAPDAVLLALADAGRRFALPEEALPELIAGVRMDVVGTSYETFPELVLYCRRVAGGVGRVCLAIFGVRDPAAAERAGAERLADELGVAMQLTNILRDVREDAENGRVYLPAQELRRFGLLGASEPPRGEALLAEIERPEMSDLYRFQAARAREWFARGIGLTPLLDRRSAASVLAMAGIYRRLLDRIDAHPQEAARRRMSLPAREKAWVAARGMLGAA
jgi:phytoene synthase